MDEFVYKEKMIPKNCPLVSVIVPNYCHASYLDQRISSILNQTYSNYEIIILDDCSVDNSKEVIERYRDNPHVSNIVYNLENSGSTFMQWDKGISLSKGSLIWIAESDDYCDPRLLEELVAAYTSCSGCILSYSLSMLVDEDGNYIHPKESYKDKAVNGASFIKKYLTFENMIRNASSVIFSKDVALSVCPQYKKYKAAGDYMFWIEMAERGNVAIVNKQLNYFRRHSGVVTNKREADGSSLYEVKEIFDYIVKTHRISSWRQIVTHAHYANFINRLTFNSAEIEVNIRCLWKVEMYELLFFQCIRYIIEYLRNHFGVFV